MTERSEEYRLEVISEPHSLSPEREKQLIDAFINLSCKASGGENWEIYQPAREGWTEFYKGKGGRPSDYDRLVLAYDGDELIHFTGLQVLRIEPDYILLWIHIAITDPAYQGSGALMHSLLELLHPDWLLTLDRFTHVIFRTPNPIVYEAMRAFARHYSSSPRMRVTAYYPKIKPDGTREAVPEEIQDVMLRAAKVLSPECPYDSDSFVIKGYFKRFGSLYKDTDFPCRVEGTKRYFEHYLDGSNQDGLLVMLSLDASPEKSCMVNNAAL